MTNAHLQKLHLRQPKHFLSFKKDKRPATKLNYQQKRSGATPESQLATQEWARSLTSSSNARTRSGDKTDNETQTTADSIIVKWLQMAANKHST